MKTIWSSGVLRVEEGDWGNDSYISRECFFGGKKIGMCLSKEIWVKKYKSSPQLFARRCVEKRIAVLDREISKACKERSDIELAKVGL